MQCNARTPSLRLTVADAQNLVVAEVEHAKLRQFPEPLDVGDLVLDKLHTRTHEMWETKKKTRKGRREGEDGQLRGGAAGDAVGAAGAGQEGGRRKGERVALHQNFIRELLQFRQSFFA